MVVHAYLEGEPVLAKVSREDGSYLHVQRFGKEAETHVATKVEVYHMNDVDALLTYGRCTLMMRTVDADTIAYIVKSIGGKVEWL